MKKILFSICTVFFICSTVHAQDKTAMIGASVSYEYFKNRINWNNQDKYSKGLIVGVEYSERKKAFGFRAGITYSKTEAYVPYTSDDLFLIDIFIIPQESSIRTFEFPVSGQIYVGEKKLKLYVSAGLSMSLSKVKEPINYSSGYTSSEPIESLSFRGIYGAGLTYQFSEHFGLDLGMNRRLRIYTLDNHPLTPMDSFGVQTKVNYIF